jgi:hypothetical protein
MFPILSNAFRTFKRIQEAYGDLLPHRINLRRQQQPKFRAESDSVATRIIRKLVRFRILRDDFVAGGISLRRGDYDGEISWSEELVFGSQHRLAESSSILVRTGESLPDDRLSIDFDRIAAVQKGSLVVL